MKNTTMKSLYRETHRFDDRNSVSVELRQWTHKAGSNQIVNTILISSVWVDEERAVYSEKCLTNKSDAQMIRLAIDEFDKLEASHPGTYVD